MINPKNNYTIYTTSDFPYGAGAENFVRQLVLGLINNNRRVNVVQIRGNFNGYNENITGVKSRYLLFKLRYKSEPLKLMELILSIVLLPFNVVYDKIINKTDYILLYGIEYFYLVFPILSICKMFDIKIIRIVTDLYEDNSIAPVFWKRLKVLFYKFQYKYIDKYLDGIIYLSAYFMDTSFKNGIKSNKVLLIPHLIDVKKFDNTSPVIITSKYRIGFFGTPVKSSGVFWLINSFKLLKKTREDIELLIVGEFSKKDLLEISEIVTDSAKDIYFYGKANTQDIPALLQTCQILVNPILPSRSADAGFPTKLAEYLSTGIPTITTGNYNMKFFFKHLRQVFIVDEISEEALCNAIIYLIKNKESANNIGKEGKKWAMNNLEYNSNVLRIIKFIE